MNDTLFHCAIYLRRRLAKLHYTAEEVNLGAQAVFTSFLYGHQQEHWSDCTVPLFRNSNRRTYMPSNNRTYILPNLRNANKAKNKIPTYLAIAVRGPSFPSPSCRGPATSRLEPA
jgi:hypothetical protein